VAPTYGSQISGRFIPKITHSCPSIEWIASTIAGTQQNHVVGTHRIAEQIERSPQGQRGNFQQKISRANALPEILSYRTDRL
jgi:hypothetical protein